MSKTTKNKNLKNGDPPPEARDEATETEQESLRARVEELEAQIADANEARQRALADFLNYQKRAMLNERVAREEGSGRVIESLLTVADYLDMALKQDPQVVSAKSVMDGVWLIREELHKLFHEHGVAPIRPQPGDEPDPARHDAMGHEPAAGVAPGRVSRLEQPGYELSGRVLRPAKVYLAPMTDTESSEE